MKLKEGYKSKYDNEGLMLHIYPENGRKHLFDNCWCNPVINKKTDITHHYYSKKNPKLCGKKK